MLLKLSDDLDPAKIVSSGQCFRARYLPDGSFRFITGRHVLYLCPDGPGRFLLSCDEDTFQSVWKPYFDLCRSYADIRRSLRGKNAWVDSAMDYGAGLRLLRQDPWETLVSFIISQRKSIPAIAGAVEKLAARFGEPLTTDREILFAFPTPEALARADEKALSACGLGYRVPYVQDAARKVLDGSLPLDGAAALADEELLNLLKTVYGVGDKVASCVSLFAFSRTACVPVDVWISRALRDHMGGMDAFAVFGAYAGIVQQYVFYYQTHGNR